MMNNKKLAAMCYYAYQIMNHENECNNLLRRGCLFQQYVVDLAAKIEGERRVTSKSIKQPLDEQHTEA